MPHVFLHLSYEYLIADAYSGTTFIFQSFSVVVVYFVSFPFVFDFFSIELTDTEYITHNNATHETKIIDA